MIRLNLLAFVLSLAVGLFIVYIMGPDYKTVNIYPTPENIDKYLFKDKTNNCFTFNMEKTRCPINPLKIKTIDPQ